MLLPLAIILSALATAAAQDLVFDRTNIHVGTTDSDLQWFSLINSGSVPIDQGSTFGVVFADTNNVDPFLLWLNPYTHTSDLGPDDTLYFASDESAFNTLFSGTGVTLAGTFSPAAPSVSVNNTLAVDTTNDGVHFGFLSSGIGVPSAPDEYYQRIYHDYSNPGLHQWSIASLAASSPTPSPSGTGAADGILKFHRVGFDAATTSSELQWLSIINKGEGSLSTENWQLTLTIMDPEYNLIEESQVILPAVTLQPDETAYIVSDESVFSDLFPNEDPALANFSALSWNSTESDDQAYIFLEKEALASEYVDINTQYGGLESLGLLEESQYYQRISYANPQSSFWSIQTLSDGPAPSTSPSASAAPSGATASSSASPLPSPSGADACAGGVWDGASGNLASTGFVPFAPQLIAGTSSAEETSRLVYDGSLTGGGAVQFRARFSHWFAEGDTTLSVPDSICSQGAGHTTTTTVSHGCDSYYHIRQASFSLANCSWGAVDKSDPDYDVVSGYVNAEATATTQFLGTDFARSFRVPLGFYFNLRKSFSADAQITVENANECYETADCNYFVCDTNSTEPNECVCTTTHVANGTSDNGLGQARNSQIKAHCETKEHVGAKCGNDNVAPVCFLSDDITITYEDGHQIAPEDLSTEIGAGYSDVTPWFDPFWDDCEAPSDHSLTDIVQAPTRTLTRSIDNDDHTSTETNIPVGQHSDTSIGNVVFQPVHDPDGDEGSTITYTITYDITDTSATGNNTAQEPGGGTCEFTVTVIDEDPPECNTASSTLIASETGGVVRGTLSDTWASFAAQSKWPVDNTLVPGHFVHDVSNVEEGLISQLQGGAQTDWAGELAVWAFASCFDSTTGDPIPSDIQSFAFCDELHVVDSDDLGEAVVDLKLIYNNIQPLNLTTYIDQGVLIVAYREEIIGQVAGAQAPNGNFSCTTQNFPAFDEAPGVCLDEGTYSAYLVAKDGAGQTSNCDAQTFTVDNTPPVVNCSGGGGAVEWTSYVQLQGRNGGTTSPAWESSSYSSLAVDNMHYVHQISTDGSTASDPLTADQTTFSITSAETGGATTRYWAYHYNADDVNTYSSYGGTDLSGGDLGANDLSGLVLTHPLSFQPTINTSDPLDTDLTRLEVVFVAQDAVGNAMICTVQYEVEDTEAPSDLGCSAGANYNLSSDLAGPGAMTAHGLAYSELEALFSVTDATKLAGVWKDNAGAISVTMTIPDLVYCQLSHTPNSTNQSGWDANQGREDPTRRRRSVAGYPTTVCTNYFEPISPTQNPHALSVTAQTISGEEVVSAADVYGLLENSSIYEFFRHPAVDITFTVDDLQDDNVVSKSSYSDGIKAERVPQGSVQSCTVPIEIEDVTAPDSSTACAQFVDPQIVMDQNDLEKEVGIALDHGNYVRMSAAAQDNAQIYQSPHYEYVHVEPDYLVDDYSDPNSTKGYERGTHDVTYTFHDSTSGLTSSCTKQITVNDMKPPAPVDSRCGVPGPGVHRVDITQIGASSEVYDLSFVVTEGQGQFGTTPEDWNIAISGGTAGSSGIQQNCTFSIAPNCTHDDDDDETWDCTAQLQLDVPGKNYYCVLSFPTTYVPDGQSKAAPTTRTCSFQLVLKDNEKPNLVCDNSTANTALVIGYLHDEDHFTGWAPGISYTVSDNAGIESNETFPDSSTMGGSGQVNTQFVAYANFTGADRDGSGEDNVTETDDEGRLVYSRLVRHSDAYGNEGTCTMYYRFEDQQPPNITGCENVTLNQDSDEISAGSYLSLNRNTSSIENYPEPNGFGGYVNLSSPFFKLWDNSYDTEAGTGSSYQEVFLAIEIESLTNTNNTWRHDHYQLTGDSTQYPMSYDEIYDPPTSNSLQFYTTWIHDIRVTLTATDLNSAASGSSTCTFTLSFQDTRAPQLLDFSDGNGPNGEVACQDEQFSVTNGNTYLSTTSDILYPLWTIDDQGRPIISTADFSAQNEQGVNYVELKDPAIVCEPEHDEQTSGNDPTWCPFYMDFRGGRYTIPSDGDYILGSQTFLSDGNLTLEIAEPNVLGFTADDGRPGSNNSTELTCSFTPIDDVAPAWDNCVYTQNTVFTSELLVSDATSPQDTTWEWSDTSVYNVIGKLFGVSLPMPKDNTRADKMIDAQAAELDEFFSSEFMQNDTTQVLQPTYIYAHMTVVDSGLNSEICEISYQIVDDVPPVVECASSQEFTYYLSNCTYSAWSGDEDDSPKDACDHTLTYTVHEDIALTGICVDWDQRPSVPGSCAGSTEPVVRGGNATYDDNTNDLGLSVSVTEVLVPTTPPYLATGNSNAPDASNNYVEHSRQQEITDLGDPNGAPNLSHEYCFTDITVVDDVPPVPLHAYGSGQDVCNADTTAAAADTRRIRVLEGETNVTLPHAILPEPWARDADQLQVGVTRTKVAGESGTADDSETIDSLTSTELSEQTTMRIDLEPGNYTFEYVYTDRSGNSASCYWQVRVYAPYEEPDTEVFTVMYYISDNGSSRRRVVLAGDSAQPSHALRQLLQATPAPRSQGLTLQYVLSATYPWVPEQTGTISNYANQAFTGITHLGSEDINCEAEGREYTDPEASSDTVTDWKSQDGICFRTYEVSVDNVDCNLAQETITIAHDVVCSPASGDHYHHTTGVDGLGATFSQAGCTDNNKPKEVTVTVAAQDFCQLAITTVSTTATLYLGSKGWMDGIIDGTTSLSDPVGTYYGGDHASEIVGEDTIIITGSNDSEVLTVCGVLIVQVDSQELDSVQFDDLVISSITYNGTYVQNNNSDSEHRNPDYTNLVGFCNNHSLPALASDVDSNGQYGISVTVVGSVDYSIDGLDGGTGPGRRRVTQGFRRSVLYEENADFQVSEVYSFTATRGADDDPFFTPNTGSTNGGGGGGGEPEGGRDSDLAWALPLGIGLLFLLCVCTTCSFMGYKTCVWARDFVLQQNQGLGSAGKKGSSVWGANVTSTHDQMSSKGLELSNTISPLALEQTGSSDDGVDPFRLTEPSETEPFASSADF